MSTPDTTPSPTGTTPIGKHGAEIRTLLTACRQAATERGRSDLADRLDAVADRADADRARVLVLGAYKSGKSELVNALLAEPLLPTDTHRATTLATVLTYADHRAVRIFRAGGGEGGGTERVETVVAPDAAALAAYVTEQGRDAEEAGDAGDDPGYSHAELGLPRKLLATGLSLVDTPGGLGAPATVATMAELTTASAVVVVSDAGRELTASELSLLRTAAAHCPTVYLVLTRIDLHPHWRRVVDLDRAHLLDADLGRVEVLPTSAALRLHAAATGDLALDAEAGIAELVGRLTRGVAGEFARRRARFVADELLAVADQLAVGVRSELAALADPDTAHRLAREADDAKVRVAALRDKASRWQQTLNDLVGDLVSDVEYDLRDRLRAVTADAEAALEDTDPAKTWDQFAPWLAERVSEATATNVVYAEERTRWLAKRVAVLFAEDGEGLLPALDLGAREGMADPVGLLAAPDNEKFGLSQSLMIGMRGSYGGVLMIGMMTTIAGMALLNPFSLGAGVLLGSKTLFDERRRARRRRQAEAKQAVRRHVDDVVFRVGKNTRDMLREVQRTLRDHFATTARELDRSLSASTAAATAAVAAQSDPDTRERRTLAARTSGARLQIVLDRAASLRAAAGDPDGPDAPLRPTQETRPAVPSLPPAPPALPAAAPMAAAVTR